MFSEGVRSHGTNHNTAAATNKGTVKVSIVPGAATLGNKAYSPNPINVKVGDTVAWTNNDKSDTPSGVSHHLVPVQMMKIKGKCVTLVLVELQL